jgi:3-oxoadipate enol-lactonase
MSERRIEVSGGRLAVHDFGAGPPVVLLHANIVDSWAWEPLTPFLLDAGYRVVAFDRRGIGDSSTEDVPFSHRADALAVLDALGLEQAALVGNSEGGQIALDTAIEYPDRVTAVVAIGANVGGWLPDQTPAENALDEELERIEQAGNPDAIADADVRAWVDGPGQAADRVPEDIREVVRDMDRAINAPGRITGHPRRLDPPAATRLDELTAPVLAVAGALDFSFAAATAAYLESNAPSARAVVMPDVAHMIGLEAPDELGALIIDFLAPLPRWS